MLQSDLESALADFLPASRELLAERALLRRIDLKYMLDRPRLPDLVRALADDYAVLPVAGVGRIATYQSRYFDTPELQCFHDHRRGRRLRQKVRIRHYPERGVSFLEVKSKGSASITDKHRHAVPFACETLGAEERAFLDTHAHALAALLVPSLRIDYQRITLIHKRVEERLTIDFALEASRGSTSVGFGSLVVVEIKRAPGGVPRTSAMRALAEARIREASLSKYCAAMALLQPDVRHNRLRPGLRALEGSR